MEEEKVSIKDFVLIKLLASGSHGKVFLSKKKNTKQYFAMKVIEKEKIKEKNCMDTIINE